MADALCICRRFRSLAVIGLELLLFDTPGDFFTEVFADNGIILSDRRRVSPLVSDFGVAFTEVAVPRVYDGGEVGPRGLAISR
jgi:hypothetical protein